MTFKEKYIISNLKPIIPGNIEIDPELDFLLVKLEQDDEFSKLGKNEQNDWLESLFYQDTKHLPGRIGPRDKLHPAKSNPKNTLRVNQDRTDGEEDSVTDPESVTAVHVNDKMNNLAQEIQ